MSDEVQLASVVTADQQQLHKDHNAVYDDDDDDDWQEPVYLARKTSYDNWGNLKKEEGEDKNDDKRMAMKSELESHVLARPQIQHSEHWCNMMRKHILQVGQQRIC